MGDEGFAKVRRRGQLLILTALKASATDEEFTSLVAAAESAYAAMEPGFVLVFDMTLMGPARTSASRA